MKRICKKCQVEKELNDYYLKKDGKVRSSFCKICYNEEYKNDKEVRTTYYKNNKEKLYQKHREWLENNKDSRNEYVKNWREENKDSIRYKSKLYVQNNSELIKSQKKSWYENNKEQIKEKERQRYRENRDKNLDLEREKKRDYISKKLEEDPLFNLTLKVRSLIRNAFKRQFTKKSKKTIEILGCSFEEFKLHLESQFDENMNWDNHGTYWHIDHIKPISLAENEKEVYDLNHYTNFQPLFWLDNLFKSNKYED
jgi:hypothetical protein